MPCDSVKASYAPQEYLDGSENMSIYKLRNDPKAKNGAFSSL